MSEKNSAPKRILVIAGLDLSLINFRGSLIKAMCDAGMEVHAAAPRLTCAELPDFIQKKLITINSMKSLLT